MTFSPLHKKKPPQSSSQKKINVPHIFCKKINVHILITEVRCFGEIPLSCPDCGEVKMRLGH